MTTNIEPIAADTAKTETVNLTAEQETGIVNYLADCQTRYAVNSKEVIKEINSIIDYAAGNPRIKKFFTGFKKKFLKHHT